MAITTNDIKKVAKLARIEIPQELYEKTASQVGGIIEWVTKLNEVNTDAVEPLTNPNESTLRMVEDKISDGNIAEDVLQNAKNSKYNYFTVPKVIE